MPIRTSCALFFCPKLKIPQAPVTDCDWFLTPVKVCGGGGGAPRRRRACADVPARVEVREERRRHLARPLTQPRATVHLPYDCLGLRFDSSIRSLKRTLGLNWRSGRLFPPPSGGLEMPMCAQKSTLTQSVSSMQFLLHCCGCAGLRKVGTVRRRREQTVLYLASKAPETEHMTCWPWEFVVIQTATPPPPLLPGAQHYQRQSQSSIFKRSEIPHRSLEAATWQGAARSPIQP
eukprot:gene22971-biopygen14831